MKKIGAWYIDDHCHFCLWAPFAHSIHLINIDTNEIFSLSKEDSGYWSSSIPLPAGTKYKYIIDEQQEFADPASFYQAQGVHGPSTTIDHNTFEWSDQNWANIALEDMIIYELHTATFTVQGNFISIASKFEHLKKLGVNTIELMPVAQFPGKYNWGYDGVYPFAVQNSYGGPEQLKRFVDLCHHNGFAVVLDVVYNHLGPEGNYLPCFGPYLTPKYKTPWGDAINFDDKHCEAVREYFIQNALYWFEYFHIDALRLDAVHGIFDNSPKHFLAELSERINLFNQQKQRKCILIAESDLNDSKLIRNIEAGGYGIAAQWNDDFHHALHTLITNETEGYYKDFKTIDSFIKAFKNNYVYDGIHSKFRGQIHGNSCSDLAPSQFVVFTQNHDQIGNRMLGERLISLSSTAYAKIAASLTILSPSIPLLFMGEEYGETNPFQYFVDHNDKNLIQAVKKGRQEEFSEFINHDDCPDPSAISTYQNSCLDWNKLELEEHRDIFNWYSALIDLRKKNSVFAAAQERSVELDYNEKNKELRIRRRKQNDHAEIVVCLDKQKASIEIFLNQKLILQG